MARKTKLKIWFAEKQKQFTGNFVMRFYIGLFCFVSFLTVVAAYQDLKNEFHPVPSEGELQRCFIIEIDGMDYLQYQIDGKWGITAASFMKSQHVDDSSDTAVGL